MSNLTKPQWDSKHKQQFCSVLPNDFHRTLLVNMQSFNVLPSHFLVMGNCFLGGAGERDGRVGGLVGR